MKNRYDNLLRKYNYEILSIVPYNPILFYITALEIKKFYKKNMGVLEIGCGEGDSAKHVLEVVKNIKVDLLDISPEMIKSCKKKLKKYKDRTEYICKDACEHLSKSEKNNIIFSCWTIHNFKQSDKDKILRSIYNNLQKGGIFILADKICTPKWKNLLDLQISRYKRYLPKLVANAIIKHEKEDASKKYRVDESELIKHMSQIGFKKIKIIDRIERDAVLVACK